MTQIPDYLGAFFTYIRQDMDTVALAETRISGSMDRWQGMPTYGVLVRAAGGTDNPYMAILLPRVDTHCYGPNRHEAMRMWRTVYGYLMGYGGGRNGFKINGVLCHSVVLEGGPNYVPDNKYPRVVGTFILSVAAVLVA